MSNAAKQAVRALKKHEGRYVALGKFGVELEVKYDGFHYVVPFNSQYFPLSRKAVEKLLHIYLTRQMSGKEFKEMLYSLRKY